MSRKRKLADCVQAQKRRTFSQLSVSTKLRILEEKVRIGWKPSEIARNLTSTGMYKLTGRTVARFLNNFQERNSIGRVSGSTRPPKMTPENLAIIEEQMEANNETTARQLQKLLADRGVKMPIRTIYRWRRRLGWVFAGTRYCQAIRVENVAKRREWAKEILRTIQGGNPYLFDNIFFTDESKIQTERHTRKSCRRLGFPLPLRGRHKHPTSVLVWGGISVKGRTKIFIFTGIMDAKYYVQILKASLLPVANRLYGRNWKLMQDNDPKHTSNVAKDFFSREQVDWWRTPAESPDCNPIENVWGSMKQYLRSVVKPTTQKQLIRGIRQFWKTLTPAVCKKYIYHLYKVLPAVYENGGMPTGY